MNLYAYPLSEQLSMVCGISKEKFRAFGSLKVQVRRVLPGETDATMNLYILRGRMEVGF